MLSFQLKKEVSSLLETFNKADIFFQMLNTINTNFPKVDKLLLDIAGGGNHATTAVNEIQRHLGALKASIQNISIRDFYASLEEFEIDLKKAKESSLDDLDIIDGILHSLNQFSDKHENFVSSYDRKSASSLIIEASKLSSMLDGFKTALLLFEHNLEEQHFETIEGNEYFSLYLPSHITFHQFTLKLTALDKLYEELCSVMNVSTVDHPLTINKIESGSLWAKIFGHSKVIQLMDDFLRATANYMYQNFTKEGKLKAIPKKVSAIEDILHLTEKLEEAGIDSSQAKEEIEKATIAVSKQLNILMDGQSEITLNEKTLSIGNEIQKSLLHLDEPLQIEHTDSTEKEDIP